MEDHPPSLSCPRPSLLEIYCRWQSHPTHSLRANRLEVHGDKDEQEELAANVKLATTQLTRRLHLVGSGHALIHGIWASMHGLRGMAGG